MGSRAKENRKHFRISLRSTIEKTTHWCFSEDAAYCIALKPFKSCTLLRKFRVTASIRACRSRCICTNVPVSSPAKWTCCSCLNSFQSVNRKQIVQSQVRIPTGLGGSNVWAGHTNFCQNAGTCAQTSLSSMVARVYHRIVEAKFIQ